MTIPGSTKTGIWVYILVFWLCGTVWLWYGPSANSFPRRFDLSSPGVGKVATKRWSFDFWISAMYVLIWTLPITLLFAMDKPTAKWRLTFHNVFVVIFSLWLFATFIHGCIFWGNANSTAAEYYNNMAHDDRWCCVHKALPGAPCAQIVESCSPGIGASDLTTSKVFLWNMWWSFAFFLFFVFDFIVLSMVLLRPAFERAIFREKAKQAIQDEQLLPSAPNDDGGGGDDDDYDDYESSGKQIRSKISNNNNSRRVKYKGKGK